MYAKLSNSRQSGGMLSTAMTGVCILAIAKAGVALGDEATRAPTSRHLALCVGINRFTVPGASTLQGCVNDANNIAFALLEDSRWTDNVYLSTDEDATKENVRGYIYWLGSQAGPGDIVVYFQSSHGSQESGTNTSLVMHDDFYSDAEFGADLATAFDSDTTVIVIVDACHSGGLFRSTASREQEAARNEVFVQNVLAAMQTTRAARGMMRGDRAIGANIGFITAADFNQSSGEANGAGFFASAFVEAMTQPDADVSDDGLLSFWELGAWAGQRASEINPNQTAQLFHESLLHATVATDSRLSPEPEPDCVTVGGCGAGVPTCLLAMAAGLIGARPAIRRRRG